MIRVLEDVRGKQCFVIQSTFSPVNSNLMELLIFIDCLKRASASSITAVIPYFGYARQDRKTEGRTPITAKLIADLITTAGASRILTMDLHANQIEGFFNIPVDHLKAFPVFVNYLKSNLSMENMIVLSPDAGGMKTANLYANELELDVAVIHKERINGEEAKAMKMVGDVNDKNVIIFDDMICTAGTICSAAAKVKEKGAKDVTVVATHGLFFNPASQRLKDSYISRVIVTDTVVPNKNIRDIIKDYKEEEINYPKIDIVSVADLLGEAILRIYQKRSVSVVLSRDYWDRPE